MVKIIIWITLTNLLNKRLFKWRERKKLYFINYYEIVFWRIDFLLFCLDKLSFLYIINNCNSRINIINLCYFIWFQLWNIALLGINCNHLVYCINRIVEKKNIRNQYKMGLYWLNALSRILLLWRSFER